MESLDNDPKEPPSSFQATKSMFPWQVATAEIEIKAFLAQSLCFMDFSTMKHKEWARQNWKDTESRDRHRICTRFYGSWSHKISQTKTESSASWGWSSADVALHIICDTSAAGETCILTNCYKLPLCLSLRCSMDWQPVTTNLSNGSGGCFNPELVYEEAVGVSASSLTKKTKGNPHFHAQWDVYVNYQVQWICNNLNRTFHQYSFPQVQHSLTFLPCFLEQSVIFSHLFLYEPRCCIEKVPGEQRHL